MFTLSWSGTPRTGGDASEERGDEGIRQNGAETLKSSRGDDAKRRHLLARQLATSKDCDLGVDVVSVSDKYRGVQPPRRTAQLQRFPDDEHRQADIGHPLHVQQILVLVDAGEAVRDARYPESRITHPIIRARDAESLCRAQGLMSLLIDHLPPPKFCSNICCCCCRAFSSSSSIRIPSFSPAAMSCGQSVLGPAISVRSVLIEARI